MEYHMVILNKLKILFCLTYYTSSYDVIRVHESHNYFKKV